MPIFVRATKTIQWDKFVDPDNNGKIDTESDWKLFTDAINGNMTTDQIIEAINESKIVKGGFNDWQNEYEAMVEIDHALNKVHLVGMNIDQIADKKAKATTTWEFAHVICGRDTKQGMITPWSTTGNNNYWSSELNNFLNSTTDNETSVYQYIMNGNADLGKNLKTVSRTVNTRPTYGDQWQLTKGDVPIFIMTAANYYTQDDVQHLGNEYIHEGIYDNTLMATQQYQYYAKRITKGYISKPCPYLVKKNCLSDPAAISYFLSSPLTKSDGAVWFIPENGRTDVISFSKGKCVAPCFCI